MPADPLRHVQAGEPLEIRADAWNALVDAARWVRAHASRTGGGVIADPITPSCMVLVRNDTGANLPSRSVVRVDDWVVTPVTYPFEVLARPALIGNTPNATNNAIAILYDAIPNGEFGRAVITGIAVCDVLVNNSTHVWAQPIASDNTKLGSVASGPARILKWETSGATRRAIVLLGPRSGFSGARLSHTVDQTAAAGVTTYLTFDTEVYDTDAYHSTSSNPTRITIAETDWYHVGAAAVFDSAGGGVSHLIGVAVSKNRTTDLCGMQINSGALDENLTASTDAYLTAGDYIEASVYNGHSSSIQIYGDGIVKPLFWVRRLFGLG